MRSGPGEEYMGRVILALRNTLKRIGAIGQMGQPPVSSMHTVVMLDVSTVQRYAAKPQTTMTTMATHVMTSRSVIFHLFGPSIRQHVRSGFCSGLPPLTLAKVAAPTKR